MNEKPSVEFLRQLFSYNQDTGEITYRVPRAAGTRAGSRAGFDNGNGYRRVSVNGKKIYSHHIIWALVTGTWPLGEIDHRNGDPSDNRFVNLRECSRAENNRNTRTRCHSKSGIKGVRLEASTGKWTSRIRFNKCEIYLGYFDTPEDAHNAYVKAANLLHGEFARAS